MKEIITIGFIIAWFIGFICMFWWGCKNNNSINTISVAWSIFAMIIGFFGMIGMTFTIIGVL